MRVLIASDDPERRLTLQRMVSDLGHESVAAADGHTAWQRLKAEPFEMVLCEHHLPGMDGLALCRQLRVDDRPGYCYFILLLAPEHSRGASSAGQQAGADEELTLPLKPEVLQLRLREAERLTSLHQQLAEQAARRRLNEQLLAETRRDPLTQLRNRLYLREDLAAIEASFEADGRCYSAILCDLDHFQTYNDQLGYAAGEAALKTVAEVLGAQVRASDRLYRFGSDAFLLTLTDLQLSTAVIVAERLCAAVRALALPTAARLTMSAGVAELQPRVHMTVAAWLESADRALAAAQTQGGDRVMAANPPDDPARQNDLEHLS